MERVIIRTNAYNAENTIKRAIDSILAQNFCGYSPVYILVDNGSIDDTGKIIDEYAKRFDFIVPLHNKVNIRGQFLEQLPDILKRYSENGYFFNLDADDKYSPNFFEKMLTFMKDNQLDVAACGSDFINNKTYNVIRHKTLDRDIILENQDFIDLFPLYRNFTTTVWGKVYSLSLLRKCNFQKSKSSTLNVEDSLFGLEVFRCAERAGILAQCLHYYYISSHSLSNQFDPYLFSACKNLYESSRKYLLNYGKISNQNNNYLHVIFFTLIKNIIPKIEKANIDLSEKYKKLYEIFTNETTQYVLAHWSEIGLYSDKTEFLQDIKKWIYAQTDQEKSKAHVNEILNLIS